MATDYFPNVLYGVVLDKADQDFLNEEYRKAMDAAEATDWDSDIEDRVISNHTPAYREKFGLPPDTKLQLVYSGSVGGRPGRCAVPAEIWLFGRGLFSINPANPADLAVFKDLPESFLAKADWLTWVEAV